MKFLLSFFMLISAGLATASIDPLESQNLVGDYSLTRGKVERNDRNFCTPKININVSANEMFIAFSAPSQISGMSIGANQRYVCEPKGERVVCADFLSNTVIQISTEFAGVTKKNSSTLKIHLNGNSLLLEKVSEGSFQGLKVPDFSCIYKKI